MRSHLLVLIGIYCLLIPASVRADNKTAFAWEVLEGCRLVNAPINDGDSFKVAHKDKTFIIRLYFVDCPEAYDTYMERVRDQASYFSIPESDVLTAGKRAAAYAHKFLKGEFTVITQWTDARGGKEPRYFGMVKKADKMLSSELIRDGLARIYGMPTKSSWPGGTSPQNYLIQLKQYERTAQRNAIGIWSNASGSLQLAGLNQLGADVEGSETNTKVRENAQPKITTHSRTGKLILNTASTAELETLPGIGPALAAYIIAARPIQAVDDLVKIPGITLTKIDAFRTHVLVNEPPPPPKTAAFYLADTATYLNKDVTIIVTAVAQSDLAAPESFRVVNLQTANQNEPGGSIPAFIPDELYDSFIQYYQEPGRTFTALLFQYEAHIVLVYRRE